MICILFSEFEASFLRLLDRITNGSKIEINETGSRDHVFVMDLTDNASLIMVIMMLDDDDDDYDDDDDDDDDDDGDGDDDDDGDDNVDDDDDDDS